MTDPLTPSPEDLQAEPLGTPEPIDDAMPDTEDTADTGAWMGDRDELPSETPDPEGVA